MNNTLIETGLTWALSVAKAYPPAAIYLGIAATVASAVLLAQPLLRALVEWTDTDVDNIALRWLLWLANLLTPAKAKRGAKVLGKAERDKAIVAKVVAEYGGAAQVPAFVLETLTTAQKDELAAAYEREATGS